MGLPFDGANIIEIRNRQSPRRAGTIALSRFTLFTQRRDPHISLQFQHPQNSPGESRA
jgi:hypothetical protein